MPPPSWRRHSNEASRSRLEPVPDRPARERRLCHRIGQPPPDGPPGEEKDCRTGARAGGVCGGGRAVDLVIGGIVIERRLADPVALLRAYREDEGTRYLNQIPITPPDRMVPEDLAVTILINSRVGSRAYKSVQDLGP